MAARLRAWVERLLPWWNVQVEAQRKARTVRRAKRSETGRRRAERIIGEYRAAEAELEEATAAIGKAGDKLADEAGRKA